MVEYTKIYFTYCWFKSYKRVGIFFSGPPLNITPCRIKWMNCLEGYNRDFALLSVQDKDFLPIEDSQQKAQGEFLCKVFFLLKGVNKISWMYKPGTLTEQWHKLHFLGGTPLFFLAAENPLRGSGWLPQRHSGARKVMFESRLHDLLSL